MPKVSTQAEPRSSRTFLVGEGEMAAQIRDKDWSRTPLGPVDTWPQSLRTTVSLCLASNFPINIIWGPGHTQIYNDGYRVVCGDAHPRALGAAYTQTWASAWPAIGGPFERALKGETSFLENQRMFLFRNGYLEETFFTFSLSPIRDESGAIGGLFHPVTETTVAMLSERRTRLLRDLNARIADARTTDEVLRCALDVLAKFPLDLPFVAFYRLAGAASHADADEPCYQFAGQRGLAPASPLLPDRLPTSDADPWPLAHVTGTGAPVLVRGLRAEYFAIASCGPYEEGPDAAFVLPILAPGGGAPIALAIAGASARLPLDEAYRDFFGLLCAALAAGLANARAYEVEQARVEALAQIDRAKTAFFSNVSHEFRTPLTLLIGPIEDALADSVAILPEVQRRRIDMARRNGLRLLKLVNTLLDFARIEAGRVEASFEAIDLAAATAELASHFRSACETAGLLLTVDCMPLGEPVYVDRDIWEKIVLNLLSNAFKFTLHGGIDVRLRKENDHAELTVSDTGAGIPVDEMPRLFERFHRIAGSQGRNYEGTGIGLALVRELVALHGGTIWVESAPGHGAAFHVAIPLGAAHLPADQIRRMPSLMGAKARAEAYVEEALRWIPDKADSIRLDRSEGVKTMDRLGAHEQRPLILLADDNADMRDYVSRILNDSGCDVAVASDGEAALSAIRGLTCPDLVLSDVMMPRLDGFGLLKKLRADPSAASVPVILLSARAGEEARVEGLAAGADDYMVKPFSGRELVARVEGVLRLATLRREKVEAERKALESALDITEDRLSLALDSARMGSWDWDIEADILQWTPMCKAIFGMPADCTITFATFLDCLHPDDRDRIEALCRDVVDPAVRAPYDTQYRVLWPDGSVHWVLARGRAYFVEGRAIRFIGAVIDVTEQKEAETHLRIVVNELSHRVKNTLAVVQSITEQTFRGGANPDGAKNLDGANLGAVRQALVGRLQALADTHTLLTQSNWRSVDIGALVQGAVEGAVGHLIKQGDGRFSSAGPPIGLRPKAALAFGLVLHELGVNALQHGAWSVKSGKVVCSWGVEDGKIAFKWSESGMDGLTPPTRRGFGSNLIRKAVAYDIAGEAEQTWKPDGMQYMLTVPVGAGLGT